MKQHLVRIFGYGFLLWLIPFLVAIPFYTRDGKLLTDIFLFKSVMLITGSLTGCLLFVSLALKISGKKFGILLGSGFIWLIINWGLDFLILLPMSKMSPGDYFIQIGLGYIAMVFVSFSIGWVADKSANLR
ncbi:hypothetical protein CH370_17925 [Leptospira kmetyi]|uniref:hypothetical protein n=1 Tax=Leptospira kmetyi TaxID=408139 RepID=UPI0002891B2E|nr:hypothetical protein [Leptospira kmetyi]EQA53354.1 hypothetical protein LEP1GSC052_2578 [Leptospira kmetyi serovar Malaysia str. Bejo-Iso9]PJZ40040.1 hypothetical protein CH370_17925 [Leptospira kmetyi]TGK19458.1 hypothetical protein EHO62_05580 [Leptospira kmetyi]TGK32840.1 hypothetical protein EHO66_03645 [Leptospira kmetyi]TGL70333.1 hypothetical protein EHQ67_05975 [Leptospira kmetyi]